MGPVRPKTSEELLEVSSFDDAAAFEAWREALEARTFEQGREAGIVEGRETGIIEGREAGILEGREAGILEGSKAGIVEGREAGLVEGREAGILEGLREALTAVLTHRGILVDSRIRESIERCTDVDLLRRWLANAMKAASASDVFPDDAS